MAQAINERLFGASKIDPDAAERGWTIGKDSAEMGVQASPVSFLNTAIQKYRQTGAENAELAVAKQKARAAGIQRILVEGSMPNANPEAKKAAMMIGEQLKADPMFAQAVGLDTSKTSSLTAKEMADMGFSPSKVTVGGVTYENPESYKTSASYVQSKQKALSESVSSLEQNKSLEKEIMGALDSVDKIKFGLEGSIGRGIGRLTGSKDPSLAEWQKLKAVLTNQQLMYTALTKGAISNAEMTLFANAVANNDLSSMPEVKQALTTALDKLKAINAAETKSLEANYGDDPTVKSIISQYSQAQEAPKKKSGISFDPNSLAAQLLK